MNKLIRRNVLLVPLVVVFALLAICSWVSNAQAAAKTYIGADGGTWETASNWSPLGVNIN